MSVSGGHKQSSQAGKAGRLERQASWKRQAGLQGRVEEGRQADLSNMPALTANVFSMATNITKIGQYAPLINLYNVMSMGIIFPVCFCKKKKVNAFYRDSSATQQSVFKLLSFKVKLKLWTYYQMAILILYYVHNLILNGKTHPCKKLE